MALGRPALVELPDAVTVQAAAGRSGDAELGATVGGTELAVAVTVAGSALAADDTRLGVGHGAGLGELLEGASETAGVPDSADSALDP
jgi:hypothetical protein